MKIWKRAAALALALALAAGLSACGDKKTAEGPSPSPSEAAPSETASPSPEGGREFFPDNEVDTAQRVLGFAKDYPLLTVNGQAVPTQRYLYWLGNMTAYYSNLYFQSYFAELDLTAEVAEGVTWDDRLKEIAYENTVMLALAPDLAQRYGVTMTEDEVDALYETSRSEVAERGEESYIYELQCMGIDDREEFDVRRLATLFEKVQDDFVEKALAGEGEGAVTDAGVDAYIEEHDLLRCKHILLLNTDSATGEALSDEALTQAKAQLEVFLDQLAAAEDKEALFDELMGEYSQDPGLATSPEGYVFTAGDMVQEFEAGTRALAVGEVSPIVETSYGYHIILRLDADCGETREQMASEAFNKVVSDFIAQAQVEKAPEYETLSAKTYYEGMVALQSEFTDPSAEATTPPLETYEPEGTDANTPVPTEP